MSDYATSFGDLLRETREGAGLSRATVGERSGLDPSHIYRIEIGGRRPSRESALALADTFGVEGEALNQWLEAAGYAPTPLLGSVAVRTRGGGLLPGRDGTATRGAVRTRGAARPPAARGTMAQERSVWRQLEAAGLDEARLARLLRAMESAGAADVRQVAGIVASTLARTAEMLEAPVRTAVIPAAGGHHRVLAPHVIQRLLLRAVREALDAGIRTVVLVLPPGMHDTLFAPLRDALDLSIVPAVTLVHRTQAAPDGVGNAILEAEPDVGRHPFAVLLPDDVIESRQTRAARTSELAAMLKAFARADLAQVVAVEPVTRMGRGGVAVLDSHEVAPRLFAVTAVGGGPDVGDAIYQQPRAFSIVGRYVLQPDVFKALRDLRAKDPGRVELTDALDQLRRRGLPLYAFELEGSRQDVGRLLDQTDALLGGPRE